MDKLISYAVMNFAVFIVITFLSLSKSSEISSKTSYYYTPLFSVEGQSELHPQNSNAGDVTEEESSAPNIFLTMGANNVTVTSEDDEAHLSEKELDEINSNLTETHKSRTEHVNGSFEHDGMKSVESSDFGTDKFENSFGFKGILPLEHIDNHENVIVNITTELTFASGLNKNDNNESTHDSSPTSDHKSPPTAINELEETEKSFVLDFHPVLTGNRTIKFRAGEPGDWHQYVDNLTSFLEPFTKEAQEKNFHCDHERVMNDNQACRFDLVYLGPSCTKENNFGYAIGKPCVIISPAEIPNWVPMAFDNESIGVPDEVQRLMRIFNSNFLFVTCEGEDDLDKVKIGPMAYLPPYQGFPSYFFPHKGSSIPNYVAPLMAVEFLNPTNGTLINVLCRAWARNLLDIPYQATLRFSLQVN